MGIWLATKNGEIKKMSQKTLDVINGISQAAANAYDGAHDEKGNPIEIGLKREEGHVVNDSRVMDGFNVRVSGKQLLVSYESEILLSDVYKSANYEDECNQMLEKIVSWLKKEYKKVANGTLKLSPSGGCDAVIEKISNKRVQVTAVKKYTINNLDDVDVVDEPEEVSLDPEFKRFLDLGGLKK